MTETKAGSTVTDKIFALIFIIYLVAVVMVAVIFFGNPVFATAKCAEIISVTVFRETPVRKSVVVPHNAPDVQIELFTRAFGGQTPGIDVALKNGVGRASQHYRPRSDDIVSGDVAFVKDFLISIVTHFAIDRGGDLFRKNRARIIKTDTSNNAVVGTEVANSSGLDTHVSAQLQTGRLAADYNLPETEKRQNSGNNYEPSSKISKTASVFCYQTIIYCLLIVGCIFEFAGLILPEDGRPVIGAWLAFLGFLLFVYSGLATLSGNVPNKF